MLTAEGFNDLFEQKLKESDTIEQAYNNSEKYHLDNFGFKRYASYMSFRVTRSKFLNKK